MVHRRWRRRHDMRAEHIAMLVTALVVLAIVAAAVIIALRSPSSSHGAAQGQFCRTRCAPSVTPSSLPPIPIGV